MDPGDDDVNIAAFDSRSVITSLGLVYMIRGVASDLKYILGISAQRMLHLTN